MSSTVRANPKAGSGVPAAADSPSTKILNVPAGFSFAKIAGIGRLAVAGAWNDQANVGLVVNLPSLPAGIKKVVG